MVIKEVKELISKDSQSFKNALAVAENIVPCKIDMMNKVFLTLEKKLAEKGLSKIDNLYDYSGQKVDSYYDQKGSTCPGLSYDFKKEVKAGVDINLRFEIKDQISLGFCTPYHGLWQQNQLTNDEVYPHLKQLPANTIEAEANDWWIYQEKLFLDNECPQFLNHNQAYCKLYDKESFDLFLDYCSRRALILLERV